MDCLQQGFSPLLVSWESFYTRNMYRHARDCWNRPIGSAPGPVFDVLERVSHDHNWNIEYDVYQPCASVEVGFHTLFCIF